jgi:hypothetical protein
MNIGIMEWWNTGILVFERILSTSDYIAIVSCDRNLKPIIPVPIFPLFHYSNIPNLAMLLNKERR